MHSVGVSTIDRVRAFPAGEQIKEVGEGVGDGFGPRFLQGARVSHWVRASVMWRIQKKLSRRSPPQRATAFVFSIASFTVQKIG